MINFMERLMRQGYPCLFRKITGLYCPGCGGTRAVLALLRGDLLLSLYYHPLVLYFLFLVPALFVCFFIYKKTSRKAAMIVADALLLGLIEILVFHFVGKNIFYLCFHCPI